MDSELDRKPNLDAVCYQDGVPKGVRGYLPKRGRGGASAGGGAGSSTTIETLRKKRDFDRVRKGRKIFMPSLMFQVAPQADARARPQGIRVGLVVSKKVGSAVVRNRVKRRLRALVREVMAPTTATAEQGCDYVVVAHPSLVGKKYDRLKTELEGALQKLKKPSRKTHA